MNPALAQAYALRAQASAMRVQLDALVLFLEASGVDTGVAVAPVGCQQCGAAADKVEDSSTIGQRSSKCTVCGAEWDL